MASPRREAKRARAQQGKDIRLRQARDARQRRLFIGLAILAVLALSVSVVFGLTSNGTKSTKSAAKTTTAPTATSSTSTTPSTSTAPAATHCPAVDGSSARTLTFARIPPLCIDANKAYTATFDTTEGTVKVALDTKKVPNTTNNFVVLSLYHYYDNTQVFRTDPSIDIIQGGSPHTQGNSDAGPGYTINDEGGKFSYQAGDLVMARTSDPNSGGGQYFFVTGPNAAGLNSQGTYVTFGHTTSGVDVLQKIIALNTGGNSGPPSHTVTVSKVTITVS